MSQRLFLLDKNYILKQAQEDLRLSLEDQLVNQLKSGFTLLFNPLGLEDSMTKEIEKYEATSDVLSGFDELYDALAGIYRYQLGNNQLEFLFDGRSHYDKYVDDWTEAFLEFTAQLCQRKNFILAGLELTVFRSPEKRIELAQNRMKITVFEHFGLKIYKYKGIQKYEVKTA